MDVGSKRKKKKNPFDSCSFASRALFLWMLPVFRLGYSKDLDDADVFECCAYDDPEKWAARLEIEWARELHAKDGSKNPHPHIKNAVFRTFRWGWSKAITLSTSGEGIIRMLHPLCIGVIVRFLSGDDVAYESALKAVLGVIVTAITLNFMLNHGVVMSQRHGNNVRAALTHLIYQKVLKLSISSVEATDAGHILNVIATDMNRFEDTAWSFNYFLSGPLATMFAFTVTFSYLGNSTLAGFLIIFTVIPLQIGMGFLFSRFRQATNDITDQRIRLMSEIVSAMKLVKLYCWEEWFAKKLQAIRKQEIGSLKKTYIVEAINSACYFISVKIVLFACFLTYVYLNGRIDAASAFIVIATMGQTKIPATGYFPQAVCLMAETVVTLERVNHILLLHERQTVSSPQRRADREKAVILENYSAKWTSSLPINSLSLSGLTFHIKQAELLVVVGPVGCGKTCLMYAMLRELEQVSGACIVNGKISYAAQESWCFGGTVKQNILLDNKYDKNRYEKVIQVCGLERDLSLFPLRDDTYVGEKGHNLSGGQKARVSLARAVYHDADIYIMDDPLSAVDPQVANHIFDKCISEFLNEKTVVLVTHQLQFLKKADRIVVLKEGKLISFGSYRDLSNSSTEFISFVDKKQKEESIRRSSVATLRHMSVVPLEEDDDVFLPARNRAKSRTQSLANISILEAMDDVGGSSPQDRDEKKQTGSVSWRVFWKYFMFCGGPVVFALSLSVSLAAQAVYAFCDLWVAAWVTRDMHDPDDFVTAQAQHHTNTSLYPNLSLSLARKSQPLAARFISDRESTNLLFYAAIVATLVVLSFSSMISLHLLLLRCSTNLHSTIFSNMMRSKIDFFENNPVGRILNRFTRDLGIIDVQIPRFMVFTGTSMCEVLGIAFTACLVNQYILIATIVITIICFLLRDVYLRTGRDLYRLDSISRSPIYHHLSSTFDGLITLRAFRVENRFSQEHLHFLRESSACRFLYCYASRSFAFCLDLLATAYIVTVFLIVLEAPAGFMPPGDAGIILCQSLFMIGEFQYMIRLTSEVENRMISTERVLEYDSIPAEAEWRIAGKKEDSGWPSKGGIVFNRVSLRYSPGSEPVLKKLTFDVRPGEKVGIVGRTGAGKSSLISVLFRLVEPDGKILIDGIDIKSLGLHELRQKLAIIPQDPSLFSGTVSSNLDPLCEYPDDVMWVALSEAHLSDAIKSMGGLDAVIAEGGTNLSVGQRQMLCMARALLKKNNILVLDEATANVDQATDELIQKMIKVNFKNFTVLTVAHRLNTVIDMDKILVLDAGRVVEFDEPHSLLKNPSGLFFSMVKQTGPQFEKMLHTTAKNSALQRGLIKSLQADRLTLRSLGA